MKKVLITGAGGFLGSHIVKSVPPGYDLYGTKRNSAVALPEAKQIALDVGDVAALQDTLEKLSPDIVIHTAALSGERACRTDVQLARRINVDSVKCIGQWAVNAKARLLFTSSDLVFDGRKGWYTEHDERHSEMVYGDLKIEAEDALADHPGALIIRLPLMYGIGAGERNGMLGEFITKGRKGEPQDLFADEFRTPLFVEDAASMIWELAGRKETGFLHLGGPERFSRLMIGAAVSTILDIGNCVVRAVNRRDKHMEYRPEDTSLDSSLANAMGLHPRSLEEGLVKVRSDIEKGLFIETD